MDYPWWIVLKDILGVLYSLSGIVLIIGVFVGIGQLKLLKKDLDIRNRRLAVETSLQYLNIYATEIIPEYEKYAREFKKRSQNLQQVIIYLTVALIFPWINSLKNY